MVEERLVEVKKKCQLFVKKYTNLCTYSAILTIFDPKKIRGKKSENRGGK